MSRSAKAVRAHSLVIWSAASTTAPISAALARTALSVFSRRSSRIGSYGAAHGRRATLIGRLQTRQAPYVPSSTAMMALRTWARMSRVLRSTDSSFSNSNAMEPPSADSGSGLRSAAVSAIRTSWRSASCSAMMARSSRSRSSRILLNRSSVDAASLRVATIHLQRGRRETSTAAALARGMSSRLSGTPRWVVPR